MRTHSITGEQFQKVLQHILNRPGKRSTDHRLLYAALLSYIWLTASRINEALAVRRNMILAANGHPRSWWRRPILKKRKKNEDGKSERKNVFGERPIDLNCTPAKIVLKWLDEQKSRYAPPLTGYVFSICEGGVKPINDRTSRKFLSRTYPECEIYDCVAHHGIRKTKAVHVTEAGGAVGLELAREEMYHESLDSTQKYITQELSVVKKVQSEVANSINFEI